MIEPKAWVSLLPNGIVLGTCSNFKAGMHFEVTGSRGNKWIFNIDEVLELALKMKDEKKLLYAKSIYKDIRSSRGLNVGFPLIYLINDVSSEFGDEALVKLHKGKNNPDDRVKECLE